MGLTLSNVFKSLFGKKDVRILMVGLGVHAVFAPAKRQLRAEEKDKMMRILSLFAFHFAQNHGLFKDNFLPPMALSQMPMSQARM